VSEASSDVPPASAAEAPSGVLTRLSPLVRRLVARNASPFTFTGTCSYIVGEGEVAIVDPGPADETHVAALLAAVAGERVSHIVVTHRHRDHAAAAPMLREKTRAPIVGAHAHAAREGAPPPLRAAHDPAYAPDAALADGERIEGRGFTLECVATPGHAANHLCFALAQEKALFSGDHVIAWSTSIVAPPDGSMADYMASLDKLASRDEAIYWPGHGGPVREPKLRLRALVRHRRRREAAILARLETGAATIPEIVAKAYAGLSPALIGAASLSTLAHLEDLVARGLVASDGAPTLSARYCLA
jgi:glyoxylase-like metal-dependent hydrolase (beta-lactamase superfamily II)